MQNEGQIVPTDLSKDIYERLWKVVIKNLSPTSNENFKLSCLKTLRILSRDKALYNGVIDGEHVKLVVRLAGLVSKEEAIEHLNKQVNYEVVMEAQKCLSNMIYNSSAVQRLCCGNSCIPGLMCRLRTFRDPDLPNKVKCFDMRILFLITAFCQDVRPSLRSEYHCLNYLIEILDEALKTQQERAQALSLRHRVHETLYFNVSLQTGD
ncbi:Synembryn-A [Armadillidium vulgare]|nr:Synembryn-A [Armadillidium vulgare]